MWGKLNGIAMRHKLTTLEFLILFNFEFLFAYF
jgi:hypothetical protein